MTQMKTNDHTVESFLELAASTVARKEDAVFATWYGPDGKAKDQYTFQELWMEAGVIAYYLREERKDIAKGDRVVLCYNFGLAFFASFLGCLRAGVTAVLVYPPHPPLAKSLAKMNKVLENCEPKLILTDSDIMRLKAADSLNPLSKSRHMWPTKIPFYDASKLVAGKSMFSIRQDGVPSFDEKLIQPEDLAFLQYTSGSTGDPKGVMVTYKALAANIELIHGGVYKCYQDDGGIPSELVGFSWLPQYHDLGLIYGVISPFVGGWRMHMMSPLAFIQNPLLWPKLMSRVKASWAIAPDFAYNLVARKFQEARAKGKEPIPGLDLSCIRTLKSAAEPIRLSTRSNFYDTFKSFGLRKNWFTSAFGLAENVVGVCWIHGYHLSVPRGDDLSPFVAVGSRETFHSSCLIKVVDPVTLREVKDNETGELWVAGPSLAAGYFKNPELSQETFCAQIRGAQGPALNYLRTGDLAFFQQDKLFICGRIKDLIIVNGVNYYPSDVETVVQEASSQVRPGCVAAFSSNDAGGDGKLEIVFELRKGIKSPEGRATVIRDVRLAVREKIGLNPLRIVAIKEKTILKTTSGKIMRRGTRAALHQDRLKILHQCRKPCATGVILNPAMTSENDNRTPSSEQPHMELQEKDDTEWRLLPPESMTETKPLEEHHDDTTEESVSSQTPSLADPFDEICSDLLGEFDPEMTWHDIGMSSMTSVELRDAVAETYAVVLRPECFEIHSTPAALKEHILVANSLPTGDETPSNAFADSEVTENRSNNVANDVSDMMQTSQASLSMESNPTMKEPLPSIMSWYEYLLVWLFSLAYRLFWNVRSRGATNVPVEESFIIASNHLTHCDFLMIAGLMPGRSTTCRLRVMAKNEHFEKQTSNPLMRFMATWFRGIPVKRDDLSSRVKALETGVESLKRGRSLLVHPEGTRSRDGSLLPFHDGAAAMARRSGCKVVPCYISSGAHHMWPAEKALPKMISTGPITICFGEPLHRYARETDQDFTLRIRNAVLSLAHELGERPEVNAAISKSLSGALSCTGIQKLAPSAIAAGRDDKGFSYSVRPTSIEQVQEAVKIAMEEGRQVIPKGSGWSRGGQAVVSLEEPSVTIDMSALSKIVKVDKDEQIAVVQAGVTWAEVRNACASRGVAPRATQSYDVFSVGGSIAANAHDRSLDVATVAEGILSVSVVMANGSLETTQPGEELFGLVCGGFGQFGIVVEVTLRLLPDRLYASTITVLPTTLYQKQFNREEMLRNGTHFQFGRLSCVPGSLFEQTMWETCSLVDSGSSCNVALPTKHKKGSGVVYWAQKILLGLLKSGWNTASFQRFRWIAETYLRQRTVGTAASRNATQQEDFSALMPWTGSLLEVFIPCGNLNGFLIKAREILEDPEAPIILNATIRWVPKDEEKPLSYAANGPCFSIVMFLEPRNKSASMAGTARKLYDAALESGGTSYLTYEPWYSPEQLKQAYPKLEHTMREMKSKYDPMGLFQSSWIQAIGHKTQLNLSPSKKQNSSGKRDMHKQHGAVASQPTQASPPTTVTLETSVTTDELLEWLANPWSHIAWHGVFLAQRNQTTLVVPIWLPIPLLLMYFWGWSLLLALCLSLLLIEVCTVEVDVTANLVRVAGIWDRLEFRVSSDALPHAVGSTTNLEVTESKQQRGFPLWPQLQRQLRDPQLTLWKAKQLSHVKMAIKKEEELIATSLGAKMETYEVPTKDGIQISLARVQNERTNDGSNRVGVFFSGYGASSLKTGSLQILPHLMDNGFSEVWFVETRISSHLDQIRYSRRLDSVALNDIPAAINHIKSVVDKGSSVHVIANCIGALTVSMSLAAGVTSQEDVTSLTCLNVALTPELIEHPTAQTELLSMYLGFGTDLNPKKLSPQDAGANPSWTERLVEFLLERFHTALDSVVANAGIGHLRYGGMKKGIHGCLFNDEKLTSSTRHAFFGYHLTGTVHYDFQEHVHQMQQKSGLVRATRFEPSPPAHVRQLPEDYLDAASALDLPICGFVGTRNDIFGTSLCRTFQHLENERSSKCRQECHVIEGFGHMDLFMGPDAQTTWLPKMTRFMLQTEQSRFRNPSSTEVATKKSILPYESLSLLPTAGSSRTALEVIRGHGNQAGKVFLVTGGTSGIGAETTKALLQGDGKVILPGRNQAAMRRFVEGLKGEGYDVGLIDWEGPSCDLGDLETVKAFAQYVRQEYSHLDVCIFNAGVMATSAGLTKQGLESTVGVNVVGHFLLATALSDITSRQVWVSSNAHEMYGGKRLDVSLFEEFSVQTEEDKKAFNSMLAYQQSKLGNILLAKEFAKRNEHMETVSVYPGIVDTNVGRQQPLVDARAGLVAALSWIGLMPKKSAEQGAATTVFCATVATVKNGAHYEDCAPARREAPNATNEDDASRFFDLCAAMTKSHAVTDNHLCAVDC